MIRKATPAELAREGYKASSRRSFDTDAGHTISRHQAEIVPRLTQLGYDDAHQRALVRKQFAYAQGGAGLDDKQERLWNEAREEGFNKKKGGKLDAFLVNIGVRNAAAEYDVGETPK